MDVPEMRPDESCEDYLNRIDRDYPELDKEAQEIAEAIIATRDHPLNPFFNKED